MGKKNRTYQGDEKIKKGAQKAPFIVFPHTKTYAQSSIAHPS